MTTDPNQPTFTNVAAFKSLYADIGRDFYAVYCASSGGKNFQGNPCPAWDDLPEAVRGHWSVVAHRAFEWVHDAVKVPAESLDGLPDPLAALATYQSYAGPSAPVPAKAAARAAMKERLLAEAALGTMRCGRRDEGGPPSDSPTPDRWHDRDGRLVCSYCGSARPEDFLARAAAGEPVTPTDKNYKVYIGKNYKVYFQHFDTAQRDELVRLVNAGELVFEHPGFFYVTPFFMTRVEPPPTVTVTP